MAQEPVTAIQRHGCFAASENELQPREAGSVIEPSDLVTCRGRHEAPPIEAAFHSFWISRSMAGSGGRSGSTQIFIPSSIHNVAVPSKTPRPTEDVPPMGRSPLSRSL